MALRFVGALRGENTKDVVRRGAIISLIAFLTLIDLFGSQALLPMLVTAYQVDAATMGVAVNASTFGMAIAGLLVAYYSDRIDRRKGIWLSLALLAIPTVLLAFTDNIAMFTALRVAQGLCMSAAFTLSITYFSEQCDVTAAAGAMAAYITGNVASNFIGRFLAVALADLGGLPLSFIGFAVLNLLGAWIAYSVLSSYANDVDYAHDFAQKKASPFKAWAAHLRQPQLRASFTIGFVILFAFVGVFTYVNFVLVGEPIGLNPAYLGLIYAVFVPAMVTTPMAGDVARRHGVRKTFGGAIIVSLVGLLALIVPNLWAVLLGMTLIAVGLFFAQAAVTGYVGRTAESNRAAANGLYLTSYYVGGLVGAFALGMVFDGQGWAVTVAIIGLALLAAFALALSLREAAAAPVAAT